MKSEVNPLPKQREDLSQDPGLGPGLRVSSGALEVTEQSAPTDRSSVFVSVSGTEAQQSDATALVIAAYGLFWLITFALVWMTFRGQERIFRRIAELEQLLAKGSKTP